MLKAASGAAGHSAGVARASAQCPFTASTVIISKRHRSSLIVDPESASSNTAGRGNRRGCCGRGSAAPSTRWQSRNTASARTAPVLPLRLAAILNLFIDPKVQTCYILTWVLGPSVRGHPHTPGTPCLPCGTGTNVGPPSQRKGPTCGWGCGRWWLVCRRSWWVSPPSGHGRWLERASVGAGRCHSGTEPSGATGSA